MSKEPHLRMLNYDYGVASPGNFKLFSRLPPELRCRIWQHAMRRPRLIRCFPFNPNDPELDLNINWITFNVELLRLGNGKVCLLVDNYHKHSKFRRVCSESRQEAKRLCRVSIPCGLTNFGTGSHCLHNRGPVRKGMLYFSPEIDILEFNETPVVKPDDLVELLYQLRNNFDHRNVGLRNIALGMSAARNTFGPLCPMSCRSDVCETLKHVFSQLDEVFFVSRNGHGRQVRPVKDGYHTAGGYLANNRSYPISTNLSTFERLSVDPRDISEDLQHVYINFNPFRAMLKAWYDLMSCWGLSVVETNTRMLITFDPRRAVKAHEIHDREGAEAFLQLENQRWPREQPAPPISSPKVEARWKIKQQIVEMENAKGLKNLPRPAFGFWLFPLDAVGPIHNEGGPDEIDLRFRAKLLDLSRYRPELCLSNFPA